MSHTVTEKKGLGILSKKIDGNLLEMDPRKTFIVMSDLNEWMEDRIGVMGMSRVLGELIDERIYGICAFGTGTKTS